MHIVHSERHQLHATAGLRPEAHPSLTAEIPARAEVIFGAVQAARLGPTTSPSDHGLAPILAVHEPAFVDFLRTLYDSHTDLFGEPVAVYPETFAVRQALREPSGLLGRLGRLHVRHGLPRRRRDLDRLVLERPVRALGGRSRPIRRAGRLRALSATGASCRRRPVRGVLLSEQRRDRRTVPPGRAPAGARVAILDVDYHHGNGTQSIFYADPSVLYCSLHADPDVEYPYYWGAADERGEGPGEGFNRNWPLPPSTDDARYLAALDEAVAAVRDFAPRYLVVSAGFDIVAGDPVAIAGFGVTTAGVGEIGRKIAQLGLPTVVVQEGGYLLERLGEDAVAFLRPFA